MANTRTNNDILIETISAKVEIRGGPYRLADGSYTGYTLVRAADGMPLQSIGSLAAAEARAQQMIDAGEV